MEGIQKGRFYSMGVVPPSKYDSRTAGSLPFGFYLSDKQDFTQNLIAPIVNNKRLPKEIRESWVQTAVELNVDKLYNTPETFE